MGEILRDIEFVRHDGFRPLTADLHLPSDRGRPSPVVVFVHGGGWLRGSRRIFCPGFSEEETFGAVMARGRAVLSIDYRLSGEAAFPAPLDDVVAAIDWVRDDGAAGYGLDAERIALWGESAGGHLAALAALRPGSSVRAVVDWYGPSDLALLLADADERGGPTREQSLLGGSGAYSDALVRAASPRFAARPDAPPFLLAHGTADDLVPPVHSEVLAQALTDAGAHAELQLVPRAGHLWRGLSDLSSVLPRALDFLDAHVR
ncbi:alpha/beta hydrolase fold domain-containing protein [Microbacterium sp. ZW T5_45]|uniref:alpha/beta hydrolase fold domain-containing protein n=1 Tax=Microbacterium sp. ZW T5_45 TaxID=3378080 RepID=UPI00385212EB